MAYRRQQYQQAQGGSDPGWMLICVIMAVILALAGLPWIIAGFVAQRRLSRWLHWRLSFLFWLTLLFVGAFILFTSFQHGLQPMIQHEFTDYTAAAKHYQTDFIHWPLRQLWADTWPIWLRTFSGIGIAGFVAEVYADIRNDPAKTLRQNERRRQNRAQRSQRRARRRTSRPIHLPDEVGGMMVVGVPISDDNEEEEMGNLAWKRRGMFGYPLKALRHHAVALGSTGSGKSVTLSRNAYGARLVYHQQVVYLDAKGETKREDEAGEDNAARFVATMQAAGAKNILVFPALYYHGWHGTPAELKNRLLSVIDYGESAFYGDVAANALDLALSAPTTPRSSAHFLANLQYDRLRAIYANDPPQYRRVLALDKHLLAQVEMRYQVFFSAMAGQLDGTLDYANADAVYLRVRGFALRAEACF
jgi:hypothetical protein